MASKSEYKAIIERKLSAESDKNQEKARAGNSGDNGEASVQAPTG